MGVSPQDWAETADALAKAGDPAAAINLLEEYFRDHAAKVSLYAMYETAPLRTQARLLIEAGKATKAVQLAKKAYSNAKHRCTADVVAYALALEAAGEKSRALVIVDEALRENKWIKEAVDLRKRLTRK
jgi:predicted Zn-dependent protease